MASPKEVTARAYKAGRVLCHVFGMCPDATREGMALCPKSMLVANRTTKRTTTQRLVSIFPSSRHSELPIAAGSTGRPFWISSPLQESPPRARPSSAGPGGRCEPWTRAHSRLTSGENYHSGSFGVKGFRTIDTARRCVPVSAHSAVAQGRLRLPCDVVCHTLQCTPRSPMPPPAGLLTRHQQSLQGEGYADQQCG